MPGARRKARVSAFQTLFEIESVGHDPSSTLSRRVEDSGLPPDGAKFAQDLVEGVLKHKERIDKEIKEAAPNWPFDQMPKVDKSILRLAIFEILFDNGVPMKAAINEAVELAKAFGSDNSAKFVNGVLGSVTTKISQ
ncbi:MAG: transcription antitermination factor NusB [Dehalococcoidia bacterium]|nr:transcription antitermination factor NusB [Dehalococcoidia bacterium]